MYVANWRARLYPSEPGRYCRRSGQGWAEELWLLPNHPIGRKPRRVSIHGRPSVLSDRASSLASATIIGRPTSIIKARQATDSAKSPSSSRHFIVSETLKGIWRAVVTK
jgi:hypothetical protein